MKRNIIQEARNAAKLAEIKEFRSFMGGLVQETEELYGDLRDCPTTDPKIAALQERIKTLEEIVAKPEILAEQARRKRANAQERLDEVSGQGGLDDLSRG